MEHETVQPPVFQGAERLFHLPFIKTVGAETAGKGAAVRKLPRAFCDDAISGANGGAALGFTQISDSIVDAYAFAKTFHDVRRIGHLRGRVSLGSGGGGTSVLKAGVWKSLAP